jgi:hypothetical protein
MSSNQSTRNAIQKAQDAANAAAYAQQQQTLQQAEQSRLNQYYVTNPNNLPQNAPTNIDLGSPAGRALYEAYKQSGVVFDSQNRIIYNPADLGEKQVEQARAQRGLPPSYKQSGEPSKQYQSSLIAAGVSAQQVQDIMNERKRLAAYSSQKAAELRQNQKDIETTQAKLSKAEIDVNNAFALDRDGKSYIYNPQYREALLANRNKIVAQTNSLLDQKQSLERDIGSLERGISSAKQIENRANFDRAFGTNISQQKQSTPQVGASIGANAGVKSVVSPIKYTQLKGSTITARQLKERGDLPATPENLNPASVIAGGVSSQSDLFKQVTGAKNAQEAYKIQKDARRQGLGTNQKYTNPSYGSRDPFGVGGFEGINADKVEQAKRQGGLGTGKAPSRGQGYVFAINLDWWECLSANSVPKRRLNIHCNN